LYAPLSDFVKGFRDFSGNFEEQRKKCLIFITRKADLEECISMMMKMML
jgi:hypothetical protein